MEDIQHSVVCKSISKKVNVESYISVVIPCYNKESFVAEALDSVLQQTCADAIREIIVVDDGSTDNTAKIILEKALESSLIRYVYQPNAGVSAARNKGIELASGSYIAFLDADDLWMPDKIKKQHAAVVSHPGAGLVYSDLYKYDYQKNKLSPVRVIAYQENERKLLFKFVAKGAPVIPSTVLVKKLCFETEGLFDTTLHHGGEDIDMWLRIARHYSFQHVQRMPHKKKRIAGQPWRRYV